MDESVTPTQRDKLVGLINKYRECMVTSLPEIGNTDVAEMKIELTNDTHVTYWPYRLAHSERERLSEA